MWPVRAAKRAKTSAASRRAASSSARRAATFGADGAALAGKTASRRNRAQAGASRRPPEGESRRRSIGKWVRDAAASRRSLCFSGWFAWTPDIPQKQGRRTGPKYFFTLKKVLDTAAEECYSEVTEMFR